MASPPSLRISPQTRSGSTDFFPYRFNPSPNCFNIGGEWIACVFTLYMKNIALAAEYCRIIGVKRIGLFYRVCNDPSVTDLHGGNFLSISFTPFYVFVEIRPTFTQFFSIVFKNASCADFLAASSCLDSCFSFSVQCTANFLLSYAFMTFDFNRLISLL